MAGIDRYYFYNAVSRHGYPLPLPQTTPGRSMVFDIDETISAWTLGQLSERGVKPAFASAIAVRVLQLLRVAPEIETLSVWKSAGKDGAPDVRVSEAAPRGETIELFRFNIAEIRQRALAGIRQKLTETESGG